MFDLNTTNRLAVAHYHWADQSESIKRLAGLSDQKQWILFTAECPRPSLGIFSAYNVNCGNMIHLKPSKTLCERAIVEKAIKSRNASAIVASNKISIFDQKVLSDLAAEYGCQVIFIEQGHMHYH